MQPFSTLNIITKGEKTEPLEQGVLNKVLQLPQIS